MTNEELAMQIQAGERDRLLELWVQIRRLAMVKAERWVKIERGGVTLEDLRQAAFLALYPALETWDGGKGQFSTWYMIHLKAAFSAATGQRTKRDAMDPLDHAASLDTPLKDEPDSMTLGDIIVDPGAEREMEEIAERDFAAYRREVVRRALQLLPEPQREAVVLRYWKDQPADSKALSAAMRALRNPAISRQLREFE